MLTWRSSLTIGVTAGAVLVTAPAPPAEAQVECSVLTEPQLLVSYSDLAPPGTITPHTMRNFVCSVFAPGAIGPGTTVDNTTINITNNTIEIVPIPAHTVLANNTGATAKPTGDTLTSVLDADLGSTPGMVVFRNNTAWTAAIVEKTVAYSFNSNAVVQTGTYPLQVTKVASMVVDSVDAYTGGSSTPSFAVGVFSNGTTIVSCGSITVGTIEATTTCTGGNTLAAGAQLTFQVLNVSGTPDNSLVQVNWHPVMP